MLGSYFEQPQFSKEGEKQDISDMSLRLTELERQIAELKLNQEITRDLPFEQQDAIREIVGEKMLDVLWNNTYYMSSFTSTSVDTSSSNETTEAKEVDTSVGLRFQASSSSRFRVNFYLDSGQTNSTVYICSPATSNDPTFTTDVPISTSDNLSYVGVKIILGDLYLVSYNHNEGREILIKTEKEILDNTTHTLEILYRVESSDIYYDKEFIGSIRNNLLSDETQYTYYPFLTSVKSASGAVNFTIEGYEFAQEKRK